MYNLCPYSAVRFDLYAFFWRKIVMGNLDSFAQDDFPKTGHLNDKLICGSNSPPSSSLFATTPPSSLTLIGLLMSRTTRFYTFVRIFCEIESQLNFRKRLAFLDKPLLRSRSVKYDCLEFSLFKTLPSCRAFKFSHNVH